MIVDSDKLVDIEPKPIVLREDNTHQPARGQRQLVKNAVLEAQVSKFQKYLRTRFSGKSIVFVVITKGGLLFGLDLYKGLTEVRSADLRLVRTSHYKDRVAQREVVVDMSDVPPNVIFGKDVVLAEDIIDTGKTLKAVLLLLKQMLPKSVTVCSVLRRSSPENLIVEQSMDDLTILPAFVIEGNFWVAGYGLDGGTDHQYRHLHYIIIAPDPCEELPA